MRYFDEYDTGSNSSISTSNWLRNTRQAFPVKEGLLPGFVYTFNFPVFHTIVRYTFPSSRL